VVDITCVEADFQRKSELIQTKTAVLNDKERELRILEQQLAARERAISWQERQLDVSNSSKHAAAAAAAAPPALESADRYYRSCADPNGQQTEKYGGHLNVEPYQRAFEYRRHVLPPDAGGVQRSSSGWPMEKLEEQFARLSQTGTADAMPRQAGVNVNEMYAQERANVKPRPPAPVIVPFRPADQRFNTANHQNVLSREHYTAVRRRGRPKGSRNRSRMIIPSEAAAPAGGLTMYNQLMRNLYTHRHLLQRNPALASAAKDAVHRGLLQVSCRPPAGNAGMMAGGCQGTTRMFAGGQLVPGEHVRRESCSGGARHQSSALPPQAAAAAAAAVMTPTVQQLLASAAYTTAASILPPLSPVAAAEHGDANTRRDLIAQDQFQRRRNSADRDVGKDVVAYTVVDDSAVATSHPHCPERAMFGAKSVRFPAEVQCQHSSDQLLAHNLMAAQYDGRNCNATVLQSTADNSHILPKVSSFGAGDGWSCGQPRPEEALLSERTLSGHKSTVRCRNIDDDDDDDDNRLVVVIDGD